jgi:histidinol-phosphate aminotransferase
MTFSPLANSWIKGLGVYEPGRPIDEVARELGFSSADEIIKLASNENALGPSPKAVKAMKSAASRMHIYPDGGAFYLRNALARKLGVESEMILPVNGSNEGIELLGHVFLGPDTNIVMADRAFIVYRLIASMFQAETIAVRMKNYVHDLDAMLEAVTEKTKIIFIANPNNPTSTMVEQDAIDRFMASVPEGVIVCFDEAYTELLRPDLRTDTLKYVRDGRNVVVLRSFSKSYGLAGLRLGYVIAPRECVELFNRVRQPFNVNAMALEAAIAALDDDAHLVKTRRMVDKGLRMLSRDFRRMGLEYVDGVANFLLVRVGSGRQVFEALKAKGVIVRPMDVYGLPDHIRVTVGKSSENRKLVRCLKEVLGRD